MDIKNFIEGLGEKKEELVKKAALCKSEEELLALAKEYEVALDKDSVAELFASMQIKPGKLSDDELDSVAGGNARKCTHGVCSHCGAEVVGIPYTDDYYSYQCICCHHEGRF